MRLAYRTIGEGEPLIILHGLFGSSDNWQTLAKSYAEHFKVYLVDQRNHGHSPHSRSFSYPDMAEDLLELVREEQLTYCNLIGHSMGGKTAMFFAQEWPEYVDKMVIADMGAKAYAPHHDKILEALTTTDFSKLTTRGQVEQHLALFVEDAGVIQFLAKGLYWVERGQLAWRMNVKDIASNIHRILEALPPGSTDLAPLFVSGGTSDYVVETDHESIREHFPNAEFTTIPEAGHWLHAEKPAEFLAVTLDYLTV
jgi:esterase